MVSLLIIFHPFVNWFVYFGSATNKYGIQTFQLNIEGCVPKKYLYLINLIVTMLTYKPVSESTRLAKNLCNDYHICPRKGRHLSEICNIVLVFDYSIFLQISTSWYIQMTSLSLSPLHNILPTSPKFKKQNIGNFFI